MAIASFPTLRTLVAVLCSLGLAGSALASDAHAEAKPAKKAEGKVDAHAAPEAKPAAKAEAKAEAKPEPKADAHAEAAPARAAKAPPMDPMDKLRERLAEKLGATKPHDAPSANVVRVAARAAAPAPVRATHAGGGHGAATPSAATLAAAHRQSAAAPAAGHGAAAGHAPHWSYNGETGPDTWAQLQPEFQKCATGTRQSPIDIREGIKVELEPVQFEYRATGFRVVDNGHTIQVNVGPGNSIEVQGRRFDLLQFHFHRPSEERINGRQYDMVAHLVHKDLDGRLAVVAVLLDRGAAQPLIQTIWNNLPLEKGDEVAAKGTIDLNALLPDQRHYYTYMGSLTTPPCSEGVLWMVMKKPVQISADQLGIFARMYPMNARPIQSAAGRTIKESN